MADASQTTPVGDYVSLWSAEDSRGYAVAIPMAINRAFGLDPQTGATPPNGWASLWAEDNIDAASDIRALIVGTCWLCATTSKHPPVDAKDRSGQTVLTMAEPVSSDNFDDAGRASVAHALLTTWSTIHAIADARGYRDLKNVPTKFATYNGFAPRLGEGVETVQNAWIIGGVVVVGMLVYAGSEMYGAYQTEETKRVIATEKTKQMMTWHAHLMEGWQSHLDAEKAAGHQLPLSEAEKGLVANLMDASKTVYDAEAKSLEAAKSDKPGFLSGIGSGVGLAIAALAALFLMKGR